MYDALLETRLRELKRMLERMGVHKGGLELGSQISLASDLAELSTDIQRTLDELFDEDAKEVYSRITSLGRSLAELEEEGPEPDSPEYHERLRSLWRQYRLAQESCDALFQDYVELIGGLAFRDRINDVWFFNAADRLLRDCAHEKVKDHSYRTVALPGMQNTIRSGLAQLVQLRFLDWTVWALPLAAFGLGRTYLTGDRKKPQRIAGEIRLNLGLPEDEAFDPGFETLMADVFATCVMGPCYALASMRLRLTPDDSRRAEVILGTLARLCEDIDMKAPDLKAMPAELRKEWEGCVAITPLSEQDRQEIEKGVDAVYSAFRVFLQPAAMKPKEMWRSAMEVLRMWEDSYDQLDEHVPDVSATAKVADVLNAAWFGRWKGRTSHGIWDEEELAKAAQAACITILERPESPEEQVQGSEQPQASHASRRSDPARRGEQDHQARARWGHPGTAKNR